jgi:hypothetical protein
MEQFVVKPVISLGGELAVTHAALFMIGAVVVIIGGLALLAPLSLLMIVERTAFEFLVAALQGYIFTVLTCIYLNYAQHLGPVAGSGDKLHPRWPEPTMESRGVAGCRQEKHGLGPLSWSSERYFRA